MRITRGRPKFLVVTYAVLLIAMIVCVFTVQAWWPPILILAVTAMIRIAENNRRGVNMSSTRRG